MKELTRIEPSRPAETTNEVRLQLERTRAKVTASAQALQADLKRRVDWKAYVHKNPWGFVLGGLAVGLLFGFRRR